MSIWLPDSIYLVTMVTARYLVSKHRIKYVIYYYLQHKLICMLLFECGDILEHIRWDTVNQFHL